MLQLLSSHTMGLNASKANLRMLEKFLIVRFCFAMVWTWRMPVNILIMIFFTLNGYTGRKGTVRDVTRRRRRRRFLLWNVFYDFFSNILLTVKLFHCAYPIIESVEGADLAARTACSFLQRPMTIQYKNVKFVSVSGSDISYFANGVWAEI